MKTMTCNQLGGACEMEFHADSFDQIAEMSRQHGMDMFQKNDQPHLKAMQDMQDMMKRPDALQKWFEEKRKEFEALPRVK